MAAAIWIAIVALPALAFVLWPLFRRVDAPAGLPHTLYDRRDELAEEKRAIYRALKELDFDHEAGHLSDGDYEAVRSRYEGRAAQILSELDSIGGERPAQREPEARAEAVQARRRGWTRHPATLTAGVLALLAFGVTLGLGIARYAERERTAGAVAPAPERGALLPVEPPAGAAGKVTPEMLRGMLDSARKSLFAGRYQEAIAAYQAVLKHDPKNVDAITHMGLIVATGGHGDSALQAFDRALSLDPNYPPAHLYRGQVLYETKQDYRGAIQAWEKFVQLIPDEENKEAARRMIREARARLANQPR